MALDYRYAKDTMLRGILILNGEMSLRWLRDIVNRRCQQPDTDAFFL